MRASKHGEEGMMTTGVPNTGCRTSAGALFKDEVNLVNTNTTTLDPEHVGATRHICLNGVGSFCK
jgi:hypothetical protein